MCIHMIFSKFFFLGGGGLILYIIRNLFLCVSIQTTQPHTMNTDISTLELQQPESEADHSSLSGA